MLRAIFGGRGCELQPYGEDPTRRKDFSNKEFEYLKKNGCLIYGLNGMSMYSLAKAGLQFTSSYPFRYLEMASMKACIGHVAIFPGMLFLPDSEYKTFNEQLRMVAEFSQQFSRKARETRGIETVIGNFPDYLEFAFQHQKTTGEQLLKRRTVDGGSLVTTVARIGKFDGHAEIQHNGVYDNLIDIEFYRRNDREEKEFGGKDPSSYLRRVVPMFVPSGK